MTDGGRVAFIALGICTAIGTCAAGCDDGDAPPVLMQVPSFRLLDQSGARVGLEELRGKVWVANFIFTSCPSVCPLLTAQMRNLQRRVSHDDLHLVSFSVDPETDTQEILASYAARHGADTSSWWFLTGARAEMRRAVEDGLRMSMGSRAADGDILHATHFVLVDRRGRIRGFHRHDGEGLQALERDVRWLLAHDDR